MRIWVKAAEMVIELNGQNFKFENLNIQGTVTD